MAGQEESIYLTECGRQDCSDLHSWGPGIRPCYIIHYVIRGSGFLEYDGKRYRIRTGESFLLYPYVPMRYYPDPEDPWEYTWIDFMGERADSLLRGCAMNREQPVAPALPAAKILPLFERIRQLDFWTQNRQEAGGLLLALLGLYRDAFPRSQEEPPRRENQRLDTALMLISSHYHKPDFHVETLCRMMHINRSTLYRLFQENLGLSPQKYLAHYRIAQACKLLDMGISVKAVSISCGFGDQFYFSRAFRQHMKTSPSAYRNAHNS